MAEMIFATFIKERETKNTIRFAEVVAKGEHPKIGTLYIQKPALEAAGIESDSIDIAIRETTD